MKIVNKIEEIKALNKELKKAGEKISFIPTMGKLHEGHAALIKEALKYGKAIVSIYVNPLQFGKGEDYDTYPRDNDGDIKFLEELKADILFIPLENITAETATFVVNPYLSNILCGLFRPGHFQGVLTIIMKLFSAINPSFAFFGLKDYQQYIMIKKMAEDYYPDIKIVPVPTVRDTGGLALSSRNLYLNEKDRKHACNFYKILSNTASLFNSGEISAEKLTLFTTLELIKNGFHIDYVKIMDKELAYEKKAAENGDILLSAVRLSGVRLIDNIFLVRTE